MAFTLLLLAAAAATGYVFDLLHVPVAWLLGGMIVSVAAAARTGKPRPLPPLFMTAGQAVVGITAGIGFPLSTLMAAGTHAVPLIVAVVITGGLSLLNGYFLWRWAGVDRATGFLGSLPGAAPTMVAMSGEMGADGVTVAVLQYLRLLLVVFLAPVAVHALFPTGAGMAGAAAVVAGLPPAPLVLNLGILAACGALGALGGGKVGLPSPNFLGPFLVALVGCWTLPWQFHMPQPAFNLAMLLVGVAIGVRFDLPMARRLGKAALVETALVLALIGICLGVGYGFHRATGVDPLTAVLGSTPGGMDVMVASAVQLGGDPGMVLAMQMTRWLLVLLAGPWIAVRLGHAFKRTNAA